ncbi:hypothetical protein DD563_14885 [Pelagicola sp. LXJ1103]|nr:hypothetical protein DD563_14885 [Pelagicola sp. LXJ1103]
MCRWIAEQAEDLGIPPINSGEDRRMVCGAMKVLQDTNAVLRGGGLIEGANNKPVMTAHQSIFGTARTAQKPSTPIFEAQKPRPCLPARGETAPETTLKDMRVILLGIVGLQILWMQVD